MIVRDDTSISLLIEFPSGPPDGNVVWKVYDPNGQIANGTINVPANAVSVNLAIASTYNQLSGGALTSYRDVQWTYTVGGATVNGEKRYTIEARLPFGVSADGVRRKLGIDEPSDLRDSEISLVSAYLAFENLVSDTTLAGADRSSIAVRDAIEAMAALALIPTMQVRIAKKEDSGTSSFQRQDIDWEAVAVSLQDIVSAGVLLLVPNYDPTAEFPVIFILAGPATDPFTGNAA